MAIDKNSKAYKGLLEKGYTDEQIIQMHEQAESGEKNVAENTAPANQPVTVGPDNANLNYYQYGDDSNPTQQGQKGGMNEKYTGEGVKTSNLEYDPNITRADLDPNYLYGENARQQNKKEAGYIARRNDMIASALYNEGLTSKDDVANFLGQQNEWMNSTEADRMNTIESVWKRLGEMQPKEEEKADISTMKEALDKDTSGKLYGKTTADEGEPTKGINTVEDANSVYKIMEAGRIATVEDMLNLGVDNLAAMQYTGSNVYSDQAWRDFKKYYPEMASQVEQKVKEMRVQDNVQKIASGNSNYIDGTIESKKESVDSNITAMASEYSNSEEETVEIKQQIEDSVATNQTASEASKTMENIESEVARLKNRLRNLRTEATNAFKGDVPDYVVNAYINNRTQEIQNQLSILEDRYNAAYQRYSTELDNSWKQKEYDLKVRQIENQESQQEFNEWYQKQQLAKSNTVQDKNGKFRELKTGKDGSLYYEEVKQISQYADSGMKGKGLKNNNPGNIKDDDFGNVIGHDDSGFAIFATPEDGFDALVEKIIFNQTNPNSRYYGTTLREYFRIYAPSSDGNNPDAYAQSVAKALGVSIDKPIKDIDATKLAAVIAKHDSGYNYSTYGNFRGSGNKTNISRDDVVVPDSVYIVEDGYQSRKVDPNSDEGKLLREAYIDDYMKNNGIVTNNTAMKTISLDSGEEYQIPMDYYRYIWGPIPTRQKDSDADKKSILEDLVELYKQGYNTADAFLAYNGIDKNADYADTARALIKYVMGAGKDIDEGIYSSLVYNLSNGNIGNAISTVENFTIPEDKKDDIINITTLAEKISDFFELVNDEKYSKYFGPLTSPINKEISKWKGNKEATKAYADLGNIYADIRQQLMGSAITEHEAEIYDPIFAKSEEDLNTVIQKLRSTLQNNLSRYNAIRGQYGLPRLDLYDEDLMDLVLYPNARARLYDDDNNY